MLSQYPNVFFLALLRWHIHGQLRTIVANNRWSDGHQSCIHLLFNSLTMVFARCWRLMNKTKSFIAHNWVCMLASPLRRANAACVVAKIMRWRVNGKDTWPRFRNNIEHQLHSPHNHILADDIIHDPISNAFSMLVSILHFYIHLHTTNAEVLGMQARAHAHNCGKWSWAQMWDESIQCIFIWWQP